MGKVVESNDYSKLAVFDFDETLVDFELSDFIEQIKKDKHGNDIPKITVPKEINDIYFSFNWPFRMNAFFKYLEATYGITTVEILDNVKKIQVQNSIKDLIQILKKNGYKLIIISDCNSLFIETVLKQNGLEDSFDKVYTNSARVDESGIIKLKAYYENILDKAIYPCAQCSTDCALPSMCKKDILTNLIKSNPKMSIIYIGDGSNDLCPATILKETDYVFARQDFQLAERLKNSKQSVKAKVKYWKTGKDIMDQLVF